MSNIYYPESYRSHPEFKRLEQRIADLEKENKELTEQKAFMLEQYQRQCDITNTYLNLSKSNHKDWGESQEIINKYIDRILCFNEMSPLKKAFYHFDIDF